jgi:uncharacterized protein (DUF924 family)
MTTAQQAPQATGIVDFWRAAGPQAWFRKDADFDRRLREQFYDQHMMAARGELEHWLDDARGALGLMLLLDQFPRNAFRGTAHMFATDELARSYAKQIVASGIDQAVDEALRVFLYLPFEHSESAEDQHRSVALHAPLGGEYSRYADLHADIIQRFGRFPHRNKVLGRHSTREEELFLADGGFAG